MDHKTIYYIFPFCQRPRKLGQGRLRREIRPIKLYNLSRTYTAKVNRVTLMPISNGQFLDEVFKKQLSGAVKVGAD